MKPLTARMQEAILASEPTFDGWELVRAKSGTASGLKKRGLIDGIDRLYLTDAGKAKLKELLDAQKA